MLDDAATYSECARRHDELIALVRYRDEFCAKVTAAPKHWWQP